MISASRRPCRWCRAHRRLGVRERMRADGRIETPLDPEFLAAAIAELARAEVEAVAVCYLHAWRDDRHEQRDRRGAARGHAVGLRLPVLRGVAADQGVRAGLHHGGQRLRRSSAGALPRPARGAPRRGRLPRAGPDHPVARRRRNHRGLRAPRGWRCALGPRGRGRRQPSRRAPDRPARPDPVRHGRHQHRHIAGRGRRRPDRRRSAPRRPTRRAPGTRHRQHRRRRRLDRAGRRGRRAARRSRERRRRARARLLRPGRHRSDRDRRQSGARAARPGWLSRWARAARSGRSRSGNRPDRGGARGRAHGGGRGHPPRRRRPHGRGHPPGLGPARGRSPPFRHARLRRRRRAARHGHRAPARPCAAWSCRASRRCFRPGACSLRICATRSRAATSATPAGSTPQRCTQLFDELEAEGRRRLAAASFDGPVAGAALGRHALRRADLRGERRAWTASTGRRRTCWGSSLPPSTAATRSSTPTPCRTRRRYWSTPGSP